MANEKLDRKAEELCKKLKQLAQQYSIRMLCAQEPGEEARKRREIEEESAT